ncbi:membrane lipoprotein lipid attachment site-containing protein [Dickeya lacustris]|uniref:Type IV secretion system putative lipoprotein virB7 n=1 Tax=Dickeya lacustris TaxID=2259638 RepID=A0ABY8G900_9GAMM|nr:membrane lipoprotein lipid attachment site-containing protein [Dickeya lacustris]WFN56407.1 membrane lipoprotein lipid attachment site-containing protein [Dickeya lacustris]
MKKLLLAVVATAMLSGCSVFSTKTTSLSSTFISPYYFSYTTAHVLEKNTNWVEDVYLTGNPARWDEIRGTYRAALPKITLTYRVEPSSNGYRVTYNGAVSYLLRAQHGVENGKDMVEGESVRQFVIPQRSVEVTFDKKALLTLTDDIKVEASLQQKVEMHSIEDR